MNGAGGELAADAGAAQLQQHLSLESAGYAVDSELDRARMAVGGPVAVADGLL
jgi:hypothetical protein